MTADAGVRRDAAGLSRLIDCIAAAERSHGPALPLVAARLVAEAALALSGEPVRPAIYLADFPGPIRAPAARLGLLAKKARAA